MKDAGNATTPERLAAILETALARCDRLASLLRREHAAAVAADTEALERIAEDKRAASEALAGMERERAALCLAAFGTEAPSSLSELIRNAPPAAAARLREAGERLARRLAEIDMANRRNAALLAAARDILGTAAGMLRDRAEPHRVYGPTGAVRPTAEAGNLSRTV
jgi:flagellar biosynthesis/type III secretory pathway chaperone